MAVAGVLAGFAAASPARASCSASTTGVGFGAYDWQSATPDDSAGSVSITCTGEGFLLFPTVSLSPGTSGSFASRRMTNGASNLQYNLYTDSARTAVWGNGAGGSSTVSVVVFFGSGSRTIYGRMPVGQQVPSGTYSDTIVVTVEY